MSWIGGSVRSVGSHSLSTNHGPGHYRHRFTITTPASSSWLIPPPGCVSLAGGATLRTEITAPRRIPMAFDLLIKNGLIVDGSGMPAFRGDVGIKNGKIVEIGKLSGAATRTIDAEGRAVAPGLIDNHCHYDAQVTWDPPSTFSPEHGSTTGIFRTCSLSL